MKLKTTINGYPVDTEISDDTLYLFCNGSMISSCHLNNLVELKQTFLSIFEVEDNQIVLRENLFGMVVKIDELETLYREVK